jgi:hypothetical protein
MRGLTKTDEPQVLKDNAETWTKEYKSAVAAGTKPRERWRDSDITSALKDETSDKCAYCEALIEGVAYSHVEHIFPKSICIDLVYAWENLTLACQICNVRKGNYYDTASPLVHPYEDDPEMHIAFAGPMPLPVLNDGKGERTVLHLDLQRGVLLVQRARAIQALYNWLSKWQAASGSDKDSYELAVRDSLSEDREFTSCLRAYAKSQGFPV